MQPAHQRLDEKGYDAGDEEARNDRAGHPEDEEQDREEQ
jgi:hypothetical protein